MVKKGEKGRKEEVKGRGYQNTGNVVSLSLRKRRKTMKKDMVKKSAKERGSKKDRGHL